MGSARQEYWSVLPFPPLRDHPHPGIKSCFLCLLHGHADSLPLAPLQFRCSVLSNSLQLHGLQHARLPCPTSTPRACSNSSPLSQWCHPTISSSVAPFSSCLQSYPASGSFPVSQFCASGGQSIGASASVIPMNIQDWFALGLTDLISLQSKGPSRVFSNTTAQKHWFFRHLAFFMVQISHPYMTIGNTIALTIWTFVTKVMSLLFNMLSRFVIAFLPKSKCLLVSWLQSPSALILEPKKIKSVTVGLFQGECYSDIPIFLFQWLV